MIRQLVYTSLPRGLKPGQSGFGVAACTRGMTPDLIAVLSSLSGYAAPYPPHDPSYRLNPVAVLHYHLVLGGRTYDVLGRIQAAGSDYSGRSNVLAHHLLFEPAFRPAADPATLVADGVRQGLFLTAWQGEAHYIEDSAVFPRTAPPPEPPPAASLWQAAGGDAGWAGILAQYAVERPREPVHIVFAPGTDTLGLLREALLCLPPALRWEVTFNTYFTKLAGDMRCDWRFCLDDCRSLASARARREAVIDLTRPGRAPDTPWSCFARGLAPRPGRPAEAPEALPAAERPKQQQPDFSSDEEPLRLLKRPEPIRRSGRNLVEEYNAGVERRIGKDNPISPGMIFLAVLLLGGAALAGYLLWPVLSGSSGDEPVLLPEEPPTTGPAVIPRPEPPPPIPPTDPKPVPPPEPVPEPEPRPEPAAVSRTYTPEERLALELFAWDFYLFLRNPDPEGFATARLIDRAAEPRIVPKPGYQVEEDLRGRGVYLSKDGQEGFVFSILRYDGVWDCRANAPCDLFEAVSLISWGDEVAVDTTGEALLTLRTPFLYDWEQAVLTLGTSPELKHLLETMPQEWLRDSYWLRDYPRVALPGIARGNEEIRANEEEYRRLAALYAEAQRTVQLWQPQIDAYLALRERAEQKGDSEDKARLEELARDIDKSMERVNEAKGNLELLAGNLDANRIAARQLQETMHQERQKILLQDFFELRDPDRHKLLILERDEGETP